ncbi:hypothetical protein M0R04_06445 [Candidatus Dojkabacteria bacterium]|jgi:hypothetical protein|nr:hypothetical protein [Candidatus Dojkabacteria bacterium]
MNEAIKLAIEKGGYDKERMKYPIAEYNMYLDELIAPLDPLFWQALGKALGWAECEPWWNDDKQMMICPTLHITPCWSVYALRFFELTLTQGDTEAFWKELLRKDD